MTTTEIDRSAAAGISPVIQDQLKPDIKGFLVKLGLVSVIAALLGVSYHPAEVNNWTFLISDAGNMATFIAEFLQPNFIDIDVYLWKMLETVQIALWGTFLSILFGIPCALLCSSNISPVWIVQPMRRMMDACRAINELVFAILFVAAVGLGPFAGVMALFIHNLGIISKLFSEAVESIDTRPVEGIRSTGATRLQEIVYGVIPQVLPLWSSFSLYRFETLVRSATVLGIVGAGGIGFTFYESFRSFQYDKAGAIILVVVIVVSLIDILSARLRKALV
ncbi:phosphonate ABC transporter, permease protein PhnE [Hwanghaeella grinnelliae]|uniref:Phosphonate ABC transporter, permease protein PhnE n=1 Tax=Hwanghaeella grinnelliae TaxID=2500179 RepID=A0A3S2W6E5_9PROT|nr:phosphonate ABC transporter, permease protein PhnE [Hwanghaeella grinnelliae]RVU33631.1 phosphonate ABC transporter, permease protein PhnE [Hwanghaeella grinnelliae]